MNKNNKNNSGLTLIEVLLAIIILSLGVTTLMIATNSCVSLLHTAKNRETAQDLLRNLETLFPIDKIYLEEIYEDGEFEDPQGFSWNREILIVDDENKPGLFLIKTEVTWVQRGKINFERINKYIYAPEAESISRTL